MKKYVAAAAILINLVCAVYIFQAAHSRAVDASRYFDGHFADGAFQLFNPMRRMRAGQTPGEDFQFFHGIGVPMAHYPLYRIHGADLSASEFSRYSLSPALFYLSAFAVGRSFFGSGTAALTTANLLAALSPALMPDLFGPGNSLLGVRTAMPLFFAAFIATIFKKFNSFTPRTSAIGALLMAICFFTGAEQGLAAFAAFIIMFVFSRRSGNVLREKAAGTIVFLIQYLFFVFAIFFAACGKSFLAPLKYALSELPADQFWYFGAPPNLIITSFHDLASHPIVFWPLAALPFFAALGLRRRERPGERFAALFLLAYAGISSASLLGQYNPMYAQPVLRVEIIFLIWYLLGKKFSAAETGGGTVSASEEKREYSAAVSFVPAALALASALLFFHPPEGPPGDIAGKDSRPDAMAGVILSPEWSGQIKDAGDLLMECSKDGRKPLLWSFYSGLPEFAGGFFNPSGYDYIIHALGPKRRPEYLKKFIEAAPELVRTCPETFEYERWLQNGHWEIYEKLLTRYRIASSAPAGVIWRIAADTGEATVTGETVVAIPENSAEISLKIPDSDTFEIISVRIEYAIENSLSAVPFAGKLPRYFVKAENAVSSLPVSLPPYSESASFSVIAAPRVTPALSFFTRSPYPPARVLPRKLSYHVLRTGDRERSYIINSEYYSRSAAKTGKTENTEK